MGERPVVLHTIAETRQQLDAWRGAGQRIGFVPTMGALHDGHLSLCRIAQSECQRVAVSIFVNPTQFGPQEDFAKYPRTVESDIEALASCGVAAVFAPAASEMYPAGFDTWVENHTLTTVLEGACRPGHFRGVTTVVLKLLNIVQPYAAYFGRKDYQQAAVIRRMVADLDLPSIIRVCPTVREADGLAMSSRNRYLSVAQRREALVLYRSLQAAQSRVAAGERDAAVVADEMRAMIEAVPGAIIDYVAVADADTLAPVTHIDRPVVALLAVRIGATRLIDNELLEPR